MKKFIFILLILFFSGMVSAQIIINSNSAEIYSLGDNLAINFSITKSSNYNSFVDLSVICGEDSELVYRSPAQFISGKTQNFSVSWYIRNLRGECNYKIESDEEIREGNNFFINNSVNVEDRLNSKLLSPGETLVISGTARKADGEVINGNMDLSIEDLFNQTILLTEGNFSFSYRIGSDLKAGEYNFTICAYDSDNIGVMNKGCKNDNFEVKSYPVSLGIDSADRIVPGKDFNFFINLYDQGGFGISNETVLARVLDANGKKVLEKSVKTGRYYPYYLDSNTPKGSWTVQAIYGSLFSSKVFYILDNKALSLSAYSFGIALNNSGNVPYIGIYELNFTNSSTSFVVPLNLSLNVGDVYLYTPDFGGNFSVNSKFGSFGDNYYAPMTGAVIGAGGVLKFWWIAFVIGVLGMAVFVWIKRKKAYERGEVFVF